MRLFVFYERVQNFSLRKVLLALSWLFYSNESPVQCGSTHSRGRHTVFFSFIEKHFENDFTDKVTYFYFAISFKLSLKSFEIALLSDKGSNLRVIKFDFNLKPSYSGISIGHWTHGWCDPEFLTDLVNVSFKVRSCLRCINRVVTNSLP